MRLLICTQALDKNHPILGFFHRWVLEFAKHCEVVHVIALEVGEYELPVNVHVHSLGKEQGKNRLREFFRFYRYAWGLRREYDAVFVHMNQIYVILGAPLWRTMGKRVGLWYAHGAVTSSLKWAILLSNIIFTSTHEGMRIETAKRKVVGQGIDVQRFSSEVRSPKPPLKLITVGRIAQSKNLQTLILVCSRLNNKGVDFTFTIVGATHTDGEKKYYTHLQGLVQDLKLQDRVLFKGAVTQDDLPELLFESDIFIHDGSTNSLDKVLVEASLSGCIVFSSNPAYRNIASKYFPESLFEPQQDAQLYEMLYSVVSQTKAHQLIRKAGEVQLFFKDNFSIESLISKITKYY